jgi:hypothetical protein
MIDPRDFTTALQQPARGALNLFAAYPRERTLGVFHRGDCVPVSNQIEIHVG